MSKSALTVLREARELISDPKRWTQGDYAKNAEGQSAHLSDKSAVCFCALGAIYRVSFGSGIWGVSWGAEKLLRESAKDVFGRRNVSSVNDRLGHEAVIRMFDAAIASAEAEGAR